MPLTYTSHTSHTRTNISLSLFLSILYKKYYLKGVITTNMQDTKDELLKEAEAEAEAAREKNLDDVLSARIQMLESVLGR